MARKFDLAAALAEIQPPVSDSDTSLRVTMIPLEDILPSPGNFYRVDPKELTGLADSIAMDGLLDPLVVTADREQPGKYRLISGHRRRAAIQLLVEDKEHPREDLRQVPCIVRSYASDALAQLQLILANATARTLTNAEISRQAEQMELLLYQLKEEGYTFPGRMRDQVAAACRVSAPKLARLKVIREHLVKCILDENLNKLTSIYRDKKAKNILGYDPIAISTFVGQLLIEYPKPKPLETEERDIDAMAEQDPNYRKQDPYAEPDFDAYDAHAIDALEQALLEMVEGSIQPPRGVAFRRTKTDDGEEWELTIENLFIASYRAMEDTYTVTFNDDRSLISRMVSKVPEFVELLQNIMMDNDY